MLEVQASLPARTAIRKRYVVETLLGKGGSGAVYLVKDLRSKNAQHNLFVLKEVIVAGKQERSRLFHEAVPLRELRHGALPHVYEIFDDDEHECVYLLMEYIKGQNLEKLLHKQPEQQFSWNDAMPMMASIIATVSYLHHQQPPIIHGDIKPANIIVLKTGFIRSMLVDYSLVKQYDATPTPIHSHLPSYRAPEQYTGGAGIQADIYGLGATFYTLLTGIVPADALSRMALLDNQGVDPLQQVNEAVPAVPAHVGRVIDQALSLDAHHRFPSVDQFWEAVWSPVGQPSLATHSVPAAWSGPSAVPEQAVAGSAAISAPGQPGVPRPWKLKAFWPIARKQPEPFSESKTASILKRTPAHRLWKLAVPFILLVLLISLGVVPAFWSYAANQHPSSQASPDPIASLTSRVTSTSGTPSLYPNIAPRYIGTLHDVPTGMTTNISLTSIQQQQRDVIGYFGGMPQNTSLNGVPQNGPFKGTVTIARQMQFTVTNNTGLATFSFEGLIQPDGTIGGTYCNLEVASGGCSDYGLWSISPAR